MTGQLLKATRKQRGLTQAETALRLRVSQPYLALLERGKRTLGTKLARRAARTLGLPATAVPPSSQVQRTSAETLTRKLSGLGYPGFAYVRSGWKNNPAEVLLAALATPDLESRVTEALPWVLLKYPDLDTTWLVRQAKVLDLTNRLGFVVDLARQVAEKQDGTESVRYQRLTQLENELSRSKLQAETTLCQESLSESERSWLREHRPEEAQRWNVLTNWKPEHLQFAY